MILADTSAWVEFDRATGSAVDTRMTELMADESELAVTEPVIMEVTAGARDRERETDLRRLMARFPVLRFEAAIDFDGASAIYRECRAVGLTPRGLIDCMVAAVALRHQARLLAHDRDLERIARVAGIALAANS